MAQLNFGRQGAVLIGVIITDLIILLERQYLPMFKRLKMFLLLVALVIPFFSSPVAAQSQSLIQDDSLDNRTKEIIDQVFRSGSELEMLLHGNEATSEFINKGNYIESEAFNAYSKPTKVLTQVEVDGYFADIAFYQDGSYIVTLSFMIDDDTNEIITPHQRFNHTLDHLGDGHEYAPLSLPSPISWRRERTTITSGTGNWTHHYIKNFSGMYIIALHQSVHRSSQSIQYGARSVASGALPGYMKPGGTSWQSGPHTIMSRFHCRYIVTPPVNWYEYLRLNFSIYTSGGTPMTRVEDWYSRSAGWYGW